MSDFDFIKEPLSAGRHGYTPSDAPGNAGTFVDAVLAAQFGDWDIPTPDSDEDLAALRLVHGLAGTTWRGIVETIESIRSDSDPTLNADGRLKIAGRVIDPKLERVESIAIEQIEHAKASLTTVHADIAKAVRIADPIDVAVHDSIRAHFKSLGGSAAVSAAYQAIMDGDTRTLQAIATAPAYLSGLQGDTSGVYAKVAAALAEHMAPALSARAAALTLGLAKVSQALGALDNNVNRTVDMKKARQLRERAREYK